VNVGFVSIVNSRLPLQMVYLSNPRSSAAGYLQAETKGKPFATIAPTDALVAITSSAVIPNELKESIASSVTWFYLPTLKRFVNLENFKCLAVKAPGSKLSVLQSVCDFSTEEGVRDPDGFIQSGWEISPSGFLKLQIDKEAWCVDSPVSFDTMTETRVFLSRCSSVSAKAVFVPAEFNGITKNFPLQWKLEVGKSSPIVPDNIVVF
jgi:hypothetical protein